MTLKSQVIAIHQLKIGDRVGYGGRYVATADSESPKRIAILSAGYADGIHRTLSDRGHVRLSGKVERVLGTVSMDLTAVACSPATRVGEYAEWLSPHLDIWLQAEAAGTIPYELLTSVSGRVQRVYDSVRLDHPGPRSPQILPRRPGSRP
jgi:alanine racemase